MVVAMISLLWLPLWWLQFPYLCCPEFPFLVSIIFVADCYIWLLLSLSWLPLFWPLFSHCCSHHFCSNFVFWTVVVATASPPFLLCFSIAFAMVFPSWQPLLLKLLASHGSTNNAHSQQQPLPDLMVEHIESAASSCAWWTNLPAYRIPYSLQYFKLPLYDSRVEPSWWPFLKMCNRWRSSVHLYLVMVYQGEKIENSSP